MKTIKPQKETYLSYGEYHNPEFSKPTPAKEVLSSARMELQSIVDGLIYIGLTLFLAGSKQGRTRLMLYIIGLITQGKPVFGKRITNESRVLYIGLKEDAQRISARLRAIDANPEVGFNSFNLDIITNENYPGILFLSRLPEYIKKRKVKIIVIDTLTGVMDENMRGKAKLEYEFINKLRKIANETGTAIIAIHHSYKDNLERSVAKARMLEEASDNVILIGRIYHDADVEYSKLLLYGRNMKRSEIYLKSGADGENFHELDDKPQLETLEKTLERVKLAHSFGMNQTQIAQVMGISQPKVSRLLTEIGKEAFADEDDPSSDVVFDDIEEFIEEESDSEKDEEPEEADSDDAESDTDDEGSETDDPDALSDEESETDDPSRGN